MRAPTGSWSDSSRGSTRPGRSPARMPTPYLVATARRGRTARREAAARAVVEQMPRAHEVERRIRGSKAATVEHAHEPTACDEEIGRDQVAVTHDVRVDLGQLPELRPQRPQRCDVEQGDAVAKARVDPLVVVGEVSAAQVLPRAPPNRRPRVSAARSAATNAARPSANGSDPAGSALVASLPGSQVCTLHGSGYSAPGRPNATGAGVGTGETAASSAAERASRRKSTMIWSASCPRSGNRAARSLPIRKIALTVAGSVPREPAAGPTVGTAPPRADALSARLSGARRDAPSHRATDD